MTQQLTTGFAAPCPECDATFASTNAVANELVECRECGTALEIVALSPPRLALAPEEEEDWGE
ncbi:MAG: lysine biosynthesis protein LysW [Methanobacteriota archaeon]